ncbi:MAG TPA: hypothetical protein VGE26_02730, partial [Sphingobacteriaceae bacterium]
MDKQKPIPPQREGAFTDTVEKVSFDNPGDARDHFQKVKKRLLDVSQWHTLCGMTTSHFQLTDAE